MSINPPLIQATQVNLSFKGQENLFAQAINLDLAANKRYLLLGPSASGKTVLLKLLAGLLTPSQGKIAWQGSQPAKKAAALITQRNQLLSLIPASFTFINLLSVKENLLLPARLNKLEAAQIKQRLAELLECFDFSQAEPALRKLSLSHLLQQKSLQGFSNGQKEMLALARGLIQPSKILIADELLRSFNQEAEAAIWQQLNKWLIKEEQSLLLATHKEHLVSSNSVDKVLRIQHQQLILD